MSDVQAIGLLLGVLGAGSLLLAVLMRRGKLPRNALLGMRTSATMASDAAWKVSHRASAWSVALAGVVLMGTAIWLVARSQPPNPDRNGTHGAMLAVLAVVVLGGAHAHRTAKRVAGEPGQKADIAASPLPPTARPERVASELVATIALALVGLAAWPLAPQELPMHWGFGGFGNFASSWVPLIAWPSSCAAVAAYATTLPRYRQRPNARQLARLMVVLSLTALLMQAVFVTL